MNNPRKSFRAFTLVELLVVCAVLALCAASLLPGLARTKAPVQRISCANNLKGVAKAFQIWAQDHGDTFPTRAPVIGGGYAEYIGQRTLSSVQATARGVSGAFLCLSNELSTPNALICPAENENRRPATTFGGTIPVGSRGLVPLTNDLNVSYFIGVDAVETNPRGFLAGDHNLGADGNITPARGFVTAPSSYFPTFAVSLGTNFVTNAGVSWLDTMHANQGNVALTDGGVRQYNRVQLQLALRNSGINPVLSPYGPYFPNPQGCLGPGLNRIQFP